MKKRIYLIICLCLITLFSFGCQPAHNNNISHVLEYDGKCSIYMTVDEYGYYHPQIVGWVALKTIPDKLTLVCSDEKVELDIKSVNPSTNGLYVMNFKQEHIFHDLEKGDNPIHLLIQIGGREFEIKNFDLYVCDDDYEAANICLITDIFDDWEALGDINSDPNDKTGSTIMIYAMDKTKYWTPFY
ncbi:MAG: hypothetical protein IJX03_07310 [Clostridia bacterium]|nr:hypothetical protein [Clostridia bacterium]